MAYYLRIWTEVEVDRPVIYRTKEEAESEQKHLQSLQPENIYKIEEID